MASLPTNLHHPKGGARLAVGRVRRATRGRSPSIR